MLLKNSKGKERNFKLLMKAKHNNKEYIIYQDVITNKVYAGLKEENKLKKINKDEINYLNKMIERIKG